MKNLLKLMLTISLAVCIFAIAVSAETVDGKCGKNASWSLDTETGAFTVSGNGEMENYVPRSTPWNSYLKHIKSLTIANGITNLGDWSFAFCEELIDINIPSSVSVIGDDAFVGCTKLASITVPNGVTSIGDGVFAGCEALTSITIPDSVISIGESAFDGCAKLMNTVDGMVYYKTADNPYFYLAYPTDRYIKSCTVNENTKFIAAKAFYLNNSLTEVKLPVGTVGIGYKAFSDCTSLVSIAIPNTLKSIGDEAFYKCQRLTSVAIPTGVTNIGDRTFYNCEKLTSVPLPVGITNIGKEAFACSGITYVGIPDSVTNIGESAFYGCMELTSLTIQNGVKTIGKYAFWNCTKITNVSVPSSVTSIGKWAFYGCSSLTEATVHSSVATFDSDVFKNTHKDLVIHGYKSSTTESYALANKHSFVTLSDNRIIMTIDSTNALVSGNSVTTDVPPIIENNRTMLPARFVAEALGATVSWDAPTRTATIEGNGVTVKITVDSTIAYVNGEKVTLDAPAFIRDNRTYTPVRFIAEALGATVEWDAAKRQAIFTK
ncbi:MAG: leucine-rich repeat protein [Clostridia bacterium]|nr:leucine-rich repeat protein [Clostridia bacterium]